MKGFDYSMQCEVDRPVGEWRAHLGQVMAQGGTRYVEAGETFAKDSRGQLVFEVYGNVQPKGAA